MRQVVLSPIGERVALKTKLAKVCLQAGLSVKKATQDCFIVDSADLERASGEWVGYATGLAAPEQFILFLTGLNVKLVPGK